METLAILRDQIQQAIEKLSQEDLLRLWDYIQELLRKQEKVPSLYKIHEEAISTGIRDLAEHHDRHLYGKAGNHD